MQLAGARKMTFNVSTKMSPENMAKFYRVEKLTIVDLSVSQFICVKQFFNANTTSVIGNQFRGTVACCKVC
jgi:hypothetical protein